MAEAERTSDADGGPSPTGQTEDETEADPSPPAASEQADAAAGVTRLVAHLGRDIVNIIITFILCGWWYALLSRGVCCYIQRVRLGNTYTAFVSACANICARLQRS